MCGPPGKLVKISRRRRTVGGPCKKSTTRTLANKVDSCDGQRLHVCGPLNGHASALRDPCDFCNKILAKPDHTFVNWRITWMNQCPFQFDVGAALFNLGDIKRSAWAPPCFNFDRAHLGLTHNVFGHHRNDNRRVGLQIGNASLPKVAVGMQPRSADYFPSRLPLDRHQKQCAYLHWCVDWVLYLPLNRCGCRSSPNLLQQLKSGRGLQRARLNEGTPSFARVVVSSNNDVVRPRWLQSCECGRPISRIP
mmetsp:Transcript_172632/g.548207  ORF Transcript_172632/g.548207 Transcript_172632/m.548207 type:complete len:250 (+) Transcript_172632:2294-3043(+)